MSASSRPSANSKAAGLVVVCCAHDDASSLEEALAPLRDDGHELDLVAGVDRDPKSLGDVIDRFGGEGLYVLCRSPNLGREKVEELREILLARHIPFARTLTVAVGGRGALADRIRSGLRRASSRGGLGLGRSKPSSPKPAAAPSAVPKRSSAPLVPVNVTEDEEPTLVGKRELGLPGSLEPVGSGPITNPSIPIRVPAAESSPITTPTRAPDLSADAGPPPPSTTDASAPSPSPPPPPPTPSEPEVDLEAQIDTNVEAVEDPSASTSGASLSELDLSDLDDTIPPPLDRTAPGTMPALITGNTVVGPAPALITGDTVVGQRLSDLRAAAGLVATRSPLPGSEDIEPTTEPFPRVAVESLRGSGATLPATPPRPTPPTPSASSPSPTPLTSSPRAGTPATTSADPSAPLDPIGPAIPTSVATAPSATGTSPANPSGLPPLGPSSGIPSPVGASPSLAVSSPIATVPGRSPLPLVLGGLAAAVLLIVGVVALWPDDDDEQIAAKQAEQERAKQQQAAEAAKEKAAQEAEPETEQPPPGPPVYAVIDALEARRVRALDVLLIATDTSKPSDFSSAASYCEQLDIEGLRGWRLPLVGELSSLSRANMIGRRGYFWSATAADTFGDDHLAWNVRRGYAQPYQKDAIAVCVRGGVNGS